MYDGNVTGPKARTFMYSKVIRSRRWICVHVSCYTLQFASRIPSVHCTITRANRVMKKETRVSLRVHWYTQTQGCMQTNKMFY